MSATYLHTQKDAGFVKNIPRVLAVVYFAAVAAVIVYLWNFTQDRYITTASFKVSLQSGSGVEAGLAQLILPGLSSSGSTDSQVAIGYIQSSDLLLDTEKEFNLIEHYSAPTQDIVYRLEPDATLEKRLIYYRERIFARADELTGQTIISVDSFDPQLSQKIAASLLKKAEDFSNNISRSVADQQLGFIQTQLERNVNRVDELTDEILKLQNEHRFINPDQAINASVAALHELQMSRLKTETELSSVLRDSPSSPKIGALRSNLRSINEMIDVETAKLSGPEVDRLNQILAQFKKLQQKLEFATQLRTGAEALLEKTRIEAVAHSHYFSVIQNPYLPEDVALPCRPYATVSIIAIAVLLFFILRALTHSVVERT